MREVAEQGGQCRGQGEGGGVLNTSKLGALYKMGSTICLLNTGKWGVSFRMGGREGCIAQENGALAPIQDGRERRVL